MQTVISHTDFRHFPNCFHECLLLQQQAELAATHSQTESGNGREFNFHTSAGMAEPGFNNGFLLSQKKNQGISADRKSANFCDIEGV
jgi:hypothetical protein